MGTKDVKRAHLYQGERAVKSDLSSMVGPVYNSGKATKHRFTGGAGYTAPKARADQQELVNKFFKRADQMEQVETIKTENKVEFSSGEERRKEALERRQEFLEQNKDLHMQLKTSEFKMTSAKTRQQLEEERESFFRNTVMRVQEEAAMLRAEEERKQKELARQEELKRQKLAWLRKERR